MGIFRLSPKHRHRRLDIITVPYNEFGCAMLYFVSFLKNQLFVKIV